MRPAFRNGLFDIKEHTMRKTILLALTLFATLCLPGLAAEAPALPTDTQGCSSDLTFLGAAPMTSAVEALPALSPMAGVEQKATGCCVGRRVACEAICAACGGVFEFNCDPSTCQSSCICFICP